MENTYRSANLKEIDEVFTPRYRFILEIERRLSRKGIGGRPSKYTEDILLKLKTAYLMGCNDENAAAYAEIGPRSIYEWKNKMPGFSQLIEGWKRNPFLKAEATIYKNLDKEDTAKWFLERRAKDQYGTRTELTGANGQDLIKSDLDKLEKTNYAKLGQEAKRQMVAAEQPVQNKEQAGTDSDVPAQLPTA